MKVSVIIPSFNAADKIGRCLASLDAIDLNLTEYEVVFVDDCSTDGTYGIIERACATRPNWRALRLTHNSGSPSRPRNHGIEAARGDYLYFLDCDDELLPDALRKLLELAQRTDACLVRSELLADDGRERTRMNRIPGWADAHTKAERRKLIITRTSAVPSSLVKRSLLLSHEIRWPDHLRMGEDSVFLAEVLVHTERIEYLAEPTYIYHKKPSLTPASTQRYGRRELLDHLEVWSTVQSLVKPLGIDYFRGRLPVGLRIALESLIFRNRGDIDEACFRRFQEFVKSNWRLIRRFTYAERLVKLLIAVKAGDYQRFVALCRPRLLIAGHDLKFIRDAVPALNEHFDVRVDGWRGHEARAEKQRRALLDWAEYIWCERLLENAEWYAEHKRPAQRLVVRMHGTELGESHGERLDMRNVDAVIAISPLLLERMLERFPNIPRDKARLLPHYVLCDDHCTEWPLDRLPNRLLERPPDRLNTLGVIDILCRGQGYRRALEVLNALHAIDPRFRLEVFGPGPEEQPWTDREANMRAYVEGCEHFIEQHGLGGAVHFNGRVLIKRALAERRVGYVLVLDDSEDGSEGVESVHLTVADALSAQAFPLVRRSPGAEHLWPEQILVEDEEDAVRKILRFSADSSVFLTSTMEARRAIQSRYPLHRFVESVVELYREHL